MIRRFFLFLLSLTFLSCSYRQQAAFWNSSGSVLYALSKNAELGTIPLSKESKLEYELSGSDSLNGPYALEICYSLQSKNKISGTAAVTAGGQSWELPLDFSFLDSSLIPAGLINPQETPGQSSLRIYYTIPLISNPAGKLTVSWLPADVKTIDRDSSIKINSMKLVPGWYGFTFSAEENSVRLSPFVYSKDGALFIDLPAALRSKSDLDVKMHNPGKITIVGNSKGNTGYFKIEGDIGTDFQVPGELISADSFPLQISGPGLYCAELVSRAQTVSTAILKPLPADPGMIISWPQEAWRDSRYEVFRWESFPSILIFDMANYDIQDRFLKRLAFFVEKAGYRGRLAPDSEIADLHGWNAHDYKSESLAAFFDLAEKTNFPLLPEERELEALLLDNGIINRDSGGNITAGTGAIISISRESEDYLRSLFIVHESFHGLYFIDSDFRDFSKKRWEALAPVPRSFILSYFDYQAYDIKDMDLVITEFMAYILQQPVSQASNYFGEILAGRIDASSWRRTVLPPKDEATGTWPDLAKAFTAEAQAFSAYVNQRWGLAAGRVRTVLLSR